MTLKSIFSTTLSIFTFGIMLSYFDSQMANATSSFPTTTLENADQQVIAKSNSKKRNKKRPSTNGYFQRPSPR